MNYKEDSFLSVLLHLLELTPNRKYEEIKKILKRGPMLSYGDLFYKGILPENFIAELLIGNNSWAKTTSMRDDHGIDIIECTRTGYHPCKCYQIKNSANPLSNIVVTKEIEKFKKSRYNQLPYYILSMSGFAFDKNILKYPNVHLIDYEYVIKLINNYSKNINSTPGSTYLLRDDDFILRFDELLKYVHEFGDCFYDHLPDSLRNWCIKISEEKRNGKLNIKKVLLLNKIGFCWDHNAYTLSHCSDKIDKVYTKYDSTYIDLINNSPQNLNLTPESTQFLKNDDFILRYNELLEYVHKLGEHYFYEHLPDSLRNWCCKIRKEKKKGRLNIEKVSSMNKIGFCWNHSDYVWNQSFDKINKIYTQYGSTYENMKWCRKPWLKKQLDCYLSGDLSSYKIRKLESINLINEWLLNI